MFRTRKNAMRSAVTATPAKLPAMPAAIAVTLLDEAGDGTAVADTEATEDVRGVVAFASVVEGVGVVVVFDVEGFHAGQSRYQGRMFLPTYEWCSSCCRTGSTGSLDSTSVFHD